ncbi:protein HEXIM1-like [Harmonia axyridis]|uniref:protein HEXIM1-like n=1 Tax=Harmonia axyridis TaxID=115357 RepID=UPI001E274F43|nr:protein HEXIM1-like [Harmonia axyridis]
MGEMIINLDVINQEMQSVADRPKDDVVEKEETSASVKSDHNPKVADDHIPQKKRKTRRGKSKRKQPYMKSRIPNVVKPEAPHNSNQFLLEDHCDFDNLDERLLNKTKASSSIFNRNRDSSFSVDSDGDFYSSPDDEEQFLIKDFDNQYETVHAEHLNNMSKADLIQEYVTLEKKVELLSNILRKRTEGDYDRTKIDLQMEIQQLQSENETLKQQNQELLSKLSNKSNCSSSDSSSDSESDSSSSSSSSVSSCDMNEAEIINNSSNNIESIDNRKCVNLSS